MNGLTFGNAGMLLDIPRLAAAAVTPGIEKAPFFTHESPTAPDIVAGWNRELLRIAPKHEQASYLEMVWVAGDPWNPVQRWMVYDFEPRCINPMGWYWEELEGPNPRTKGRYDRVLRKFVSSEDQSINLLSWNLFRTTGRYARPFWVCQGTDGGHPRWYTQMEERMRRMKGMPVSPPLPGELPYSEPDRRTWDRIGFYDRLLTAGAGLNSLNPTQLREAEREMTRAMLKWLGDTVEDTYKDVAPKDVLESSRVVHEEPEWVKDVDAQDDRILNRSTIV